MSPESLVGSNEEPAFILDSLPNRGIDPATHPLLHNRLRVVEAGFSQ
jgi:hypothetical protein